jgi:hypothetical protein
VRRILLTGISGTGKTALVRALEAHGHRAVDLDQPAWSEWVETPGAAPGETVEPGRGWSGARTSSSCSAVNVAATCS